MAKRTASRKLSPADKKKLLEGIRNGSLRDADKLVHLKAVSLKKYRRRGRVPMKTLIGQLLRNAANSEKWTVDHGATSVALAFHGRISPKKTARPGKAPGYRKPLPAARKRIAIQMSPLDRIIHSETTGEIEKITKNYFLRRRSARAKLAEKNTLMFMDFFIYGLSFKEMEKKYGVSRQGMNATLNKALKDLKTVPRFLELAIELAGQKK